MGKDRDGAARTRSRGLENITSGAGCGGLEDTKTDTENLPKVFEGGKMCSTPLDVRQGTAGWKMPKKRYRKLDVGFGGF